MTTLVEQKKYPEGGRDWRSVTVTYRRTDGGLIATKVGEGPTHADALADADRQLRPGTWERLCVSNINSVYTDVKGGAFARNNARAARLGEGVKVTIRKPEVRRK